MPFHLIPQVLQSSLSAESLYVAGCYVTFIGLTFETLRDKWVHDASFGELIACIVVQVVCAIVWPYYALKWCIKHYPKAQYFITMFIQDTPRCLKLVKEWVIKR